MPDVLDDFDRLLEQERDCLLSGDYDALPELGERKLKLADALPADGDAARLARIGEQLERNQALLEIARDAFAEATAQGERARTELSEFTVYGPGGQSQRIRDAGAGLSRKA